MDPQVKSDPPLFRGMPFKPLTDEQVAALLIGTDDVIYEMSRPTMVNCLVLLAREVKHWRSSIRLASCAEIHRPM